VASPILTVTDPAFQLFSISAFQHFPPARSHRNRSGFSAFQHFSISAFSARPLSP
jgi:hypothetical protein